MTGTNDMQTEIQKEILELASAISDVVRKFRELKDPLAESHDKVPRATKQLDKITEQTEAAAHQMLDKVEQITQREEEVIEGLAQLKDWAEQNQAADACDMVDKLIEKANTTVSDAYTIMNALQFQDITSQQMHHAAFLLDEVEGKLHGIISVLHGKESASDPQEPGKQKKERIFDPHADVFDKRTDQSEIDSLVSRKNST